jgi:NADH-quinone oxidoreductase subunit D
LTSRRSRGQPGRDDNELLTLNIGPHHPATHGVLRLLVTLEGEVVRDLKPIIGYVHTGIEKTAEQKAYWKVIPVIERMDYLSYYFNAMAFCGAVETLLECEVPKRAQYLRVIHLELNRIMSHLVWLGTSALDLGAMSMFWYCFRERETILDLFEFSSGQRMHTRYFQVGGVIEDIPKGFEEKLREFSRSCRAAPISTRPAQAQRDPAAAPARDLPARRGDAARTRRHRPAAACERAIRGTCARPRRTAL